jgi:UDP-N-acetylglucosamine--N-acetylmuramyl-(pentapeptide) pyrophosphoryl-undecaprenol N-acetylglucosamine transferase
VLVPLPGAPGDHQTANAEALVAAGAAVMVPDAELDAARLDSTLESLLADPARLVAMAEAARSLGRPDATARFADLVEAVGGWSPSRRGPGRLGARVGGASGAGAPQ